MAVTPTHSLSAISQVCSNPPRSSKAAIATVEQASSNEIQVRNPLRMMHADMSIAAQGVIVINARDVICRISHPDLNPAISPVAAMGTSVFQHACPFEFAVTRGGEARTLR
ncbi:hypothetical protein [Rhizobium leguminosarum]|uniref:Uncharacterized protein n=1 Tax=Rhizobium leguminosarum TaxID=384 RepID=A0A7W9ZTN5_RHILE|nr:hypothetical protein [Rhizobium leguminosarum]MBB6222616.1 hypothetical protein [Rhizobium leguminosarum]